MSEKLELRYRTEMDLTEDFLRKAVKASTLKPAERISWIICAVYCILCAVFLFAMGQYRWALIVLLLVVLIVGIGVLGRRYATRLTMNRWNEQYHQENVRTYGGFTDAGYVQGRVEKDDSITLHYADINSLTEADGAWVIRTKASLLVFYNAAPLSETDRKSVLSFLQEKNPKIKIKLPKA